VLKNSQLVGKVSSAQPTQSHLKIATADSEFVQLFLSHGYLLSFSPDDESDWQCNKISCLLVLCGDFKSLFCYTSSDALGVDEKLMEKQNSESGLCENLLMSKKSGLVSPG